MIAWGKRSIRICSSTPHWHPHEGWVQYTPPTRIKGFISKTLLKATPLCTGIAKSCSRESKGVILWPGRSRTELKEALGPKGQVRALDGVLHRLHRSD